MNKYLIVETGDGDLSEEIFQIVGTIDSLDFLKLKNKLEKSNHYDYEPNLMAEEPVEFEYFGDLKAVRRYREVSSHHPIWINILEIN